MKLFGELFLLQFMVIDLFFASSPGKLLLMQCNIIWEGSGRKNYIFNIRKL